MESLLGGPTSRPETFTYGNIGEDANTKIKQVFPASPNDRDFLTLNRLPLPRKFESKTTPTSDLSRMTSPDVSTLIRKNNIKLIVWKWIILLMNVFLILVLES